MNLSIKIVLLFILFFYFSLLSFSQDTIYINKAWHTTIKDSAVAWRYPCSDTGYCKVFYLTGELLADVRLEYGKFNGIGFFYYKNGRLEEKVNFHYNVLKGEYSGWYKNGQQREGGRYSDKGYTIESYWDSTGVQTLINGSGSTESYYKNMKIKSKGGYLNGKKNGVWIDFYENGIKLQEGAYQNDLMNGEWKVWKENGNLDYIEIYKKGRMVEGIKYSQEGEMYRYIKRNKKGNIVKYTPSDWAAQFSIGGTKYFYDKETKKYFGNHGGPIGRLTIFYNNFFLGLTFAPSTVNPRDSLILQGRILFKNADLNIIKTSITLGYSYKLTHNFSIDPYVGYLSTAFLVINEAEIGQSYNFSPRRGITAGFLISKSIRLNLGQSLAVYINPSVNYSNYSKPNSSLGNSFYSIEFGIGYKGWFSKKVKE